VRRQSKVNAVSALFSGSASRRNVSPKSSPSTLPDDNFSSSAASPSISPATGFGELPAFPRLPSYDSFLSITKIVEEKADSTLVEGEEIVSARHRIAREEFNLNLSLSLICKFDDDGGIIRLRFQTSLKNLNPNNSISSLSIHKVIASGEKDHFKQKHRKTMRAPVASEGKCEADQNMRSLFD
jgi:hypothetical protein